MLTELITAIKNNSLSEVERLITNNDDIRNDFPPVTEFLTNAKAKLSRQTSSFDINSKDDHGNTPIFYATILNHSRVVKYLVEQDCYLDILDTLGKSILYHPIHNNYTATFDALVTANNIISIPIVNIADEMQATPLHYAVQANNEDCVIKLLKLGADPCALDSNGISPLHLCARGDNVLPEIVIQMMVDYAMNIDVGSEWGTTPLMYAVQYFDKPYIKMLLAAGADPNARDPAGYTILHALIDVEELHYDLLDAVINDYGADINVQANNGDTPLHLATRHGNIRAINYLCNLDAIRPNVFNGFLQTPLQDELYQLNTNITSVAKLLPLTDLSFQDHLGYTSLWLLFKKRMYDLLETFHDVIVSKPLNIYVKNRGGKFLFEDIDQTDLPTLVALVAESYLLQLGKNHHGVWQQAWENICAQATKHLSAKDNKTLEQLLAEGNVYLRGGSKGALLKNTCLKIIKKNVQDTIEYLKQYGFSLCYTESRPLGEKTTRELTTLYQTGTIKRWHGMICGSLLAAQNTTITTANGSLIERCAGYIYILQSFPDIGVPLRVDLPSIKDHNDDSWSWNVVGEILWDGFTIQASPAFPQSFQYQMKTKRYIITAILIIMDRAEGAINHIDMLFYDAQTKELERFEPHGARNTYASGYKGLDTELKLYFSSFLGTITYYTPVDFLPFNGFQDIDLVEIHYTNQWGDTLGFCQTWVFWYVSVRMTYINFPDITRNDIFEIINRVYRGQNLTLRQLIRNFSINLVVIRDVLFEKLGIPLRYAAPEQNYLQYVRFSTFVQLMYNELKRPLGLPRKLENWKP